MESDGGLWQASDAYTSADEVVETAQRVGTVALCLDFRDLRLLERLPGIRYLHLRSDGRPELGPIAALTGLRALILETSALRGDLDLVVFPELRWLRIGLGGKGGAAVLRAIQRGHAGLEWLNLNETKARSATDACAGFPNLRVLRIGYADHMREPGGLAVAVPKLRPTGAGRPRLDRAATRSSGAPNGGLCRATSPRNFCSRLDSRPQGSLARKWIRKTGFMAGTR
jgi:hypothetical protein